MYIIHYTAYNYEYDRRHCPVQWGTHGGQRFQCQIKSMGELQDPKMEVS